MGAIDWLAGGGATTVDKYEGWDESQMDAQRANQAGARGDQQWIGDQWKKRIAGESPSVAENQLKETTAQNQRQQIAMSRSGGGPMGGAGAQYSAMQNAADINQTANRQGATLRAQEQMAAEQNYANNAAGMRGQDQSMFGAEMGYQGMKADSWNSAEQAQAVADEAYKSRRGSGVAGMAGAGAVLGGAALMSDPDTKTDIQPASNQPASNWEIASKALDQYAQAKAGGNQPMELNPVRVTPNGPLVSPAPIAVSQASRDVFAMSTPKEKKDIRPARDREPVAEKRRPLMNPDEAWAAENGMPGAGRLSEGYGSPVTARKLDDIPTTTGVDRKAETSWSNFIEPEYRARQQAARADAAQRTSDEREIARARAERGQPEQRWGYEGEPINTQLNSGELARLRASLDADPSLGYDEANPAGYVPADDGEWLASPFADQYAPGGVYTTSAGELAEPTPSPVDGIVRRYPEGDVPEPRREMMRRLVAELASSDYARGPSVRLGYPRNSVNSSDPKGKTAVNYSRASDEPNMSSLDTGGAAYSGPSDWLDPVEPVTYRYKDPELNAARGALNAKGQPGAKTAGPNDRNLGVLTTDLQRTPEGRQLVVKTKRGDAIDPARAMSPMLAAMAEQEDRLDALEAKMSGKPEKSYDELLAEARELSDRVGREIEADGQRYASNAAARRSAMLSPVPRADYQRTAGRQVERERPRPVAPPPREPLIVDAGPVTDADMDREGLTSLEDRRLLASLPPAPRAEPAYEWQGPVQEPAENRPSPERRRPVNASSGRAGAKTRPDSMKATMARLDALQRDYEALMRGGR